MFGFYMGVDPRTARETTRLVLNELEKIKGESVDAAELNGAREYTKGSLLLASESADNQMVRCAQNEIHFGKEVALQDVIQKIEAVTPQEIQDLANDLFDRSQMTLTLLGPLDSEKEAFEEILYR
jgi:predicted Zn-dependent peptidase